MKQTTTPYYAINLPDKQTLVGSFAGKTLDDLRTPAFVIDRNVFAKNCAKMHEKAISWGAGFRAHLKTHKVSKKFIFFHVPSI
jgi:D-serine ammonia-lyase